RRQGRPLERLLLRDRQPRLLRRRLRPLPDDRRRGRSGCRQTMAARGQTPGIVRGAGPPGRYAGSVRLPMHTPTAAFPLVVATCASAALLAQAPDRSKPPASGPVPALKLPAIQKRALTNGLPVWIVEMHEVPVVDVSLIVKSGATSDPTGKFGVAS